MKTTHQLQQKRKLLQLPLLPQLLKKLQLLQLLSQKLVRRPHNKTRLLRMMVRIKKMTKAFQAKMTRMMITLPNLIIKLKMIPRLMMNPRILLKKMMTTTLINLMTKLPLKMKTLLMIAPLLTITKKMIPLKTKVKKRTTTLPP